MMTEALTRVRTHMQRKSMHMEVGKRYTDREREIRREIEICIRVCDVDVTL